MPLDDDRTSVVVGVMVVGAAPGIRMKVRHHFVHLWFFEDKVSFFIVRPNTIIACSAFHPHKKMEQAADAAR